jgi:CheY-like chemotaxis protein
MSVVQIFSCPSSPVAMRRFLRILVIEDNDPRYAILERLFGGASERVRLARAITGGAALRMIRSDPFDLILLDHDLQENRPVGLENATTTGFDIARALAAGGPNRRTPIRIHSMNISRRQEMHDFLEANGHDVEVIPMFDWTEQMARDLVDDLLEELEE